MEVGGCWGGWLDMRMEEELLGELGRQVCVCVLLVEVGKGLGEWTAGGADAWNERHINHL